ncbi:type III-B CRISPR module-associated Cmr3 family protein [Vibrio spartinae]|uniref:CRISPR-associated protein (Cas_Cmr3) n=1 Tax=Vibrio spartinae TaxID=1918945 RepID=A0A1N6MAS7_9VIBR|nr:type III-B CRISPR module-associated Cmr3 family protein [Vibrio spartinae]SIO96524.1 CRISPR-associated protein (Cas_Cmr3) [Vibrio spartinae]
MKYYLIKPKDPLVIRSSRPFEEISDAKAARFPPPSTVAGAMRNLYARSRDLPLDAELLKVAVTGPLAVKLSLDDTAPSEKDILVPKPADVQYFCEQKQNGKKYLVRSVPTQLDQEQEGCDLPDSELMPLLPSAESTNGKPVNGPQWWSLKDLQEWRQGKMLTFGQIESNGWNPTDPDIRTHIALDNPHKQAKEGMIFQTTGLTMWQKPQPNSESPFPEVSIALLAGIETQMAEPLPMMNLGGERRLAQAQACNLWPQRPENLAQNIIDQKGLTITFLTPVLFNQGWLPGWIDSDTLIGTPPCCKKLELKLRAAALEPWLPQSGWDLVNRRPRAAQKMVPAGATYWFELNNPVEADISDIEALWMAHLCDPSLADQYPNNQSGFGLALPAVYTFTHS